MRIVIFASAYAPAIGGVEELTARLAKQLTGAGDEVEVWTIRHPATLPAAEEIEGVSVRRFELPLPSASLARLAGFPAAAHLASRRLLDAAAGFRPDVIHVQCFSANGVWATWLARRIGAGLVLTSQGETLMDDDDIFDRSTTLRLGLRVALRRAHTVTACSRFVLDDLESRFGLERGRGAVVPNGVDPQETAPALPFELPFDRFVLGLGRVVPKKGFDLLVDAFAQLAERHPGLGLVIAGDGPERSPLATRAETLGLTSRVALPGALGRGQVAWAAANASVFVLPSRIEPFGIVVLEALRAGCPVVVSSRGGATEIVRDEVDGLVVDPTDVGALAAAIDRVLSVRGLAAALEAAGPRRAAEFSWAALRERYVDLYRSALIRS